MFIERTADKLFNFYVSDGVEQGAAAQTPAAAPEAVAPAVAAPSPAADGQPEAVAPPPIPKQNIKQLINLLIDYLGKDKLVYLHTGDGDDDIQKNLKLSEILDTLGGADYDVDKSNDEYPSIQIGIRENGGSFMEGYEPENIKNLLSKVEKDPQFKQPTAAGAARQAAAEEAARQAAARQAAAEEAAPRAAAEEAARRAAAEEEARRAAAAGRQGQGGDQPELERSEPYVFHLMPKI